MVDRGSSLPSPFAGRYEIVRELGRGASAVVYLVRDQQHDRELALKVLSADYASALGAARFLREVRLASRLQHPYIVPVLDSGEWEGWLFYVMPVIEGQPLRVRMTRERQLPVADAVRYTMEIADALQHAHDHGVLHRDVKPENILVSGHHACLADFGIARAITPATGDEITTTGVILGTPAYMSPEQASSDGTIDGRSDQYALGCVLFEMLAGVPPFVGPTEQSIIYQRFEHAPPSVRHYRQAVDPVIEGALARALQVVPADRFPSARGFSEAIALASLTPSGSSPAVSPSPLRRLSLRTLAGALVLGVVAMGAWWRLSQNGEALAAASASSLIAEPDADASSAARDLFQRAKADFAAGRLDSAEARFARAANADPSLALASLWEAQLIQWRADAQSAGDWTVPARRSMRYRDRLSPRDAHHALALVALGEERYSDACGEFGEAVRADSQSFVGWFGLGECRRMDRAVIPDRASTSGLRFRAELSDAIAAYAEALAWVPGEQSAPLLSRTLSVFYGEPSLIRTGRALAPDSGEYVANPTLIGDTVAFVPYRADQLEALDRTTAPRNHGDALQRLREMERTFVRRWIRRMPGNVHALYAISLTLETRGLIADDDDRTPDALALIRDARRRNADPRMRVLLEAAEVRLLAKSGRFVEAGHLADSTLGADVVPDRAAGALAALAALQGRERETALHLHAFWSGPDGLRGQFTEDVPAAIAARLVPLVAAIETGHCAARYLDSLERRIEEFSATMEEPADSGGVSATLLDDLRVRAAVCTNGRSVLRVQRFRNPYAQLANAAARQDRKAVLNVLSRLDAMREGVSRSSVTWDAVAVECWALASTGAVSQAAARLDSSLVGLAYSSNRLTTELRLAGGLRRVLELRADLAVRQADTVTSQRWRAALNALSYAQ